MITYHSSDIIKRAEQLADLENSQFISFAEKIALLNEAYTSLYQKSINHDVNSFIKYINTRNNIIQLPPDFYQLKAITMSNGRFITPITRRPANGNFTDLSYDIINNTLQINGLSGTIIDSICVEYYPVPTTLTFPNRNEKIELGDVLDIKGHTYIIKGEDADHILVRSIDDADWYKELSATDIENWLIHIEDDWITLSNSATTILFNQGSGNTITTNYPVVIYKSHTYLYDNDNLILPELNIVVEPLDIDVSNCSIIMLSNDKTKWCGQNYNGGFYINGVHQDFSASKMFYWEDKVYLCNGTNLLQLYDFNTDKIVSSLEQTAVIAIQGINPDTGYGYLGKKMGHYEMISFFDDTSLNFPNNTYFVYMSYLLALAFRQKQGSDYTQLAELTNVAEQTFLDTINRDDWCVTRITNVY